ncbi:MAG TPA: hypothetical protein EYP14_12460 [Planctomycetaceae bacterium]|nr:hypothetical protein [Planctomycetaceae bacterium]
MRDYETEMLVYAKLAELAARRRQRLGRDRFLLLAGLAACRAGWPSVADRCRRMVLDHNPQHLVGRYDSMSDAVRDVRAQTFFKRLERFCPFERAEYLLSELGIAVAGLQQGQESPGQSADRMLDACEPPKP